MVLKRRLTGILRATIAPIRERRSNLARDPDFIMDVLRTGTAKGRNVTERTKREVMEGLDFSARDRLVAMQIKDCFRDQIERWLPSEKGRMQRSSILICPYHFGNPQRLNEAERPSQRCSAGVNADKL